MTAHRRHRARPATVLVALAAFVAMAACTPGSPDESPAAPGTTAEPPPASPESPSPSTPGGVAVDGPVELVAPEGGSFLVRGAYPRVASRCLDVERRRLLARYPGGLTVERSDDGTLALTVTLPFEQYLEGIAEVPASWPRAALEAQAIAARSYALATTGWDGAEGETLATPICATTACQVYRGIPVPRSSVVRRWYAAVRRTDGEVLVSAGRPADTVYFSTSNGRTYGNEDVFGSAPLPYLRPVVERDDGASPVSRWRVDMPLSDVATFLHEAGLWRRSRPISRVVLAGGTVTVAGGGVTRSMDLSAFRDAVNAWAPCLRPDRYPPSPLPVTIPSRWVRLSTSRDALVATGRGWGHGAGMVQWGAYGKALRGWSAADILAYYYGGLRPESFPEPGLIDVQVASGLTALRVLPSGEGARLDGRQLGRERVTIEGGGELTVAVEAR
jgi:stage II sporulation protein D